MMHMLLGVSARSIGRAPYATCIRKSKNLRAAEIGIQAGEGARLYCLPSVSAYIGADIVAGAYVCELRKQQKNVLFIDIGTNGEIVFSDHGMAAQLFLCGRSGTGRNEYQFRHACGGRCDRGCKDHRTGSETADNRAGRNIGKRNRKGSVVVESLR